MEELLGEVRKTAQIQFMNYVADSVKYVPAFKEFGMRLIRFSREEPELYSEETVSEMLSIQFQALLNSLPIHRTQPSPRQ